MTTKAKAAKHFGVPESQITEIELDAPLLFCGGSEYEESFESAWGYSTADGRHAEWSTWQFIPWDGKSRIKKGGRRSPPCIVPDWVLKVPHIKTLSAPDGYLWRVHFGPDSFAVTLGQVPYNRDWVCCEHGADGPREAIALALKRIHRDYLDQLDHGPDQAEHLRLAKDYEGAVAILAMLLEAAP